MSTGAVIFVWILVGLMVALVVLLINIATDFVIVDRVEQAWSAGRRRREAAASASQATARREAEAAALWKIRESVIESDTDGYGAGAERRRVAVDIVRVTRYPVPYTNEHGVTITCDERTSTPLRIGAVAIDREDFEIELTSVRLAAQARAAALNDRSVTAS